MHVPGAVDLPLPSVSATVRAVGLQPCWHSPGHACWYTQSFQRLTRDREKPGRNW